jgi:hypothetical protein
MTVLFIVVCNFKYEGFEVLAVVVMKSTLFEIVHESNLMADSWADDAIKRCQHNHQAVLWALGCA